MNNTKIVVISKSSTGYDVHPKSSISSIINIRMHDDLEKVLPAIISKIK